MPAPEHVDDVPLFESLDRSLSLPASYPLDACRETSGGVPLATDRGDGTCRGHFSDPSRKLAGRAAPEKTALSNASLLCTLSAPVSQGAQVHVRCAPGKRRRRERRPSVYESGRNRGREGYGCWETTEGKEVITPDRDDFRIAILASDRDRSPKVLALSLASMLKRLGVECEILWGADEMLGRMSLRWARHPRKWRMGLRHCGSDHALVGRLRRCAGIVFSKCCPNAFMRGYGIERLRRHLPGIPIAFHEVYYLGNAPYQQAWLREGGHFGVERYDWHLAVSEVTEVRGVPSCPWSAIGLDLTGSGLEPGGQQDMTAIIDFARPGYEALRQQQRSALLDVGFNVIELDGEYSLTEIRSLYRKACAFFPQFPEAFGLAMAECLASGAFVFLPDSSWAMSFRLDAAPMPHTRGTLAGCFKVYSDANDLRERLRSLRRSYDPCSVAAEFRRAYPTFASGNLPGLRAFLEGCVTGWSGKCNS